MLFQFSSNFFNCRVINIDSVMLANDFSIIPNFPLAAHINVEFSQLELQSTKSLLKHIFIHRLHEAHSLFPVPVSRVPFHSNMLRQMLVRIIFIAKTRTEVINFLKSSTNQSLQWQFVANSQIKLLIAQRIHMRHKWVRVRTASGVLQNRNINLDEPMTIQIISRCLPKLTSANESLTNFRIDIHINIASTQALFLVL